MVNVSYTLVLLIVPGLVVDGLDLENFSIEKLIERGIDYLNATYSVRATKTPQATKRPVVTSEPPSLEGEASTIGVEFEPGPCEILTRYNVPKDNQPVYTYNGSLVFPHKRNGDSTIFLNEGESLSVHCTGRRNQLIGGNETGEIECLGGTSFIGVNGEPRYFKQIICSKRAQAELLRTGKKCSSKSASLLEIGFKADGWQKMIEVCHDEEEEKTIFTRHKLSYLVLHGSEKNKDRPYFVEGLEGLYHGRRVNDFYKVAKQRLALSTLLGREDYFDSKDLFLARGHLAPDGDFIFSNWQHSTYYFVNVAPQWQSINSGAWLMVEDLTRRLANNLNSDLLITTGVLGNLQLPDVNMNYVTLYMDPIKRMIPVPQYFWKNIYSPSLGQSITFLVENNPYNQSEPICKSICKETGWKFRNTIKRGTVICCKSDDIEEIYPYLTISPALHYVHRKRT